MRGHIRPYKIRLNTKPYERYKSVYRPKLNAYMNILKKGPGPGPGRKKKRPV